MTDIPEDFRSIIKAATLEHFEDVSAAVDSAYEQIIEMDDFAEFQEKLVRHSIQEHVYDFRHKTATDLKRRNGDFGGPAKVGTSTGAANRVAAMCFLDSYPIDGRSLGSILGKELPALRDAAIGRGRGAFVDAAVCSALIPLVAEEKEVRQCVSDKKAEAIHGKAKALADNIGLEAMTKQTPILAVPSTNGHARGLVAKTTEMRGRKTKAAKVAVAN